MDFGDALLAMHKGRKVRRRQWQSSEGYLHIRNPEIENMEEFIYSIYITQCNVSSKWNPNQSDILATDWEILK
jgi:hypothetical protein